MAEISDNRICDLQAARDILNNVLGEVNQDRYINMLVCVDAGHGGLDLSGKYHSEAAGKQYNHKSGIYHNNSSVFYEGVSNRTIAEKYIQLLGSQNIPYLRTYHPIYDYGLKSRYEAAKAYYDSYEHVFFVSFHSDAFNGKANRFDVHVHKTRYTEIEKTFAVFVLNELSKYFESKLIGSIKYSNFAVLRESDDQSEAINITAILGENLFFDTKQGADMLTNPQTQQLIALSYFEATKKIISYVQSENKQAST